MAWGLGSGGSDGRGGGEGDDKETMGDGRGDAIGRGDGANTGVAVDLAEGKEGVAESGAVTDDADMTEKLLVSSPGAPPPCWSCNSLCRNDYTT